MNTKPKDMIGARFGSWTVVEIDDEPRREAFTLNAGVIAE